MYLWLFNQDDMMRLLLFFLCVIILLDTNAQVSFSNETFLFGDFEVRSGAPMGVADVNGDGLDDIIRLDKASDLTIGYQQPDGSQFEKYFSGNVGPGSEWGMCIGDVNHDGLNDIICGGSGSHRIKVHLMHSSGVDSAYALPPPSFFLQAINLADINNDGWADVFACNDNGLSAPYNNLGGNIWEYDLGLINAESTVPSDNSGNYGSVWTDYDSDGDLDLYISKCRQGISDTLDGRRINLLFENDGSNNYTDVAVDRGLVPYAQSWATDFGDIDNDGDMDCFVANHDKPSILYENIGDTIFKNINISAGLDSLMANWGDGIQVVMDDYDNDGFLDIMLSGRQGLLFLVNNGDMTFVKTNEAFPSAAENMHSMAVGDLNNDGSLDLIAGFANGFSSYSNKEDILFMNDGNDHHWIKLGLVGRTSNMNGIGARAEIYGAWGVQIREVRSGESYGIQNTFDLHFGLGSETEVDSLVIGWPSGTRDVIWNPQVDIRHALLEGCNPLGNSSISLQEAEICAGETFEFLGQLLTEAGEYDSVVVNMDGCPISNHLVLDVVETDANVSQTGNMLSAASGMDYQWVDCGNSNAPIVGETGQSFTPTTDGSYAVIITNGTCEVTSECFDIVGTLVFNNLFPFEIKVYPNPVVDVARLEFSSTVHDAELLLHNIYGAALWQSTIRSASEVEVDMSGLPAGNYILEMLHEGRSGSIRLVKH